MGVGWGGDQVELRQKRASGCDGCNVYIKEAGDHEPGSLTSSITAVVSVRDATELMERCTSICHPLLT